MANNYLAKLNANPAVKKHIQLLNETGILTEIVELNKDLHNLDDLLSESIKLFGKKTLVELINYVTTKMLDKFIPEYLAFVIQEEIDPDSAYVLCYRHLQPIERIITVPSLKPYKKFFSLSPAPVDFRAFIYMINDNTLTDIFLPLKPRLLLPFIGLNEIYGFIILGKRITGLEYTNDDIDYLTRVMNITSVSLQNIIHYRRATIDSKTRLYNHSFFTRRLDEELARVKRYHTNLALLIFDIDSFKQINDKYGHPAGDAVLQSVARIVESSIRQEDVAARFGGDEFIILLIETTEVKAKTVANRIKEKIENQTVIYDGHQIKYTISMGGTSITKDSFCCMNEIVQRADTALYNSKNRGKNMIVFS